MSSRKKSSRNTDERRIAAAGLHPDVEFAAVTLQAAHRCLREMAIEHGKVIDQLTEADIAGAFIESYNRFRVLS